MGSTVEVKRAAPGESRMVEAAQGPLADGAVRLAIESFAVTANNVTYAVLGTPFRYWDFFPASQAEWGVVPVWGHARITESRHPALREGERVYGYLPMADGLDVLPGKVTPGGFMDMAPHRQPMSPVYNSYTRLAADPEHVPAREEARMLFGPLFKTGYLIDAFFRREDWFGASQCILTSASSKTALGLAHCIRANGSPVRLIGLTSPGNAAFVRGTGLFDAVLDYGAVASLPVAASVSVDLAGNAAVLRGVHDRLEGSLRHSAIVGATHVGARDGAGAPMPGPAPALFFAPDHAVALVKEMGPHAFAADVARCWSGFLTMTDGLVRLDVRNGLAGAADGFAALLAGTSDPATGIIVRP